MKFIESNTEFESVQAALDSLVLKGQKFPESVTKGDFFATRFLSFDWIFTRVFFRRICAHLKSKGESKFWLSVIEPEPRTYFFKHFGQFGSLECRVEDSDREYIRYLNQDPGGSPADAIIHNSNLIAVCSASREWVIVGDRASESSVLAFRSQGWDHGF